MTTNSNYWKKRQFKASSHNISLFRFLGHYGFNCKNKNILDVGCGEGADLIEFRRRGSNVYGVDINIPSLTRLQKIIGKSKIKLNDETNKIIPFSIKFNLIYSIDFIFYLSEQEINSHFKSSHKSLKKNGIFLFRYIEEDLLTKKKIKNKYNFEKNYIKKTFSEKDNPIKFYNMQFYEKILNDNGFKIKGTKFLIESYGIEEKKVRINKYILCTKK